MVNLLVPANGEKVNTYTPMQEAFLAKIQMQGIDAAQESLSVKVPFFLRDCGSTTETIPKIRRIISL